MTNAKLVKEVYVSTANEVGALEKLVAPLAEAKVNVWGFCGWVEEDKANFAIVTDNNKKAVELLEDAGYTTDEHDAVAIELDDKPGTLWGVSQKLKTAGIDGKYMYVTTCGGCAKARLVLGTSDNNKAVKTLG